ncbi:MAG: hypothetical protein HQL39_13110 [Alphaproteobacteria bacterium]|nr:hypothetical protein [Alphaproteobacteria bacterium]
MTGPHPELYIDGLLDVSFARGIVRVDVYSYSATEKHANGQPKPELRQRMVMGSQAFIDFVNGLQLAVQSLREKGALPGGAPTVPAVAPPAEPAAEAQPSTPEPAQPEPEAAPTVRHRPRSPNFPEPSADDQTASAATAR